MALECEGGDELTEILNQNIASQGALESGCVSRKDAAMDLDQAWLSVEGEE